MSEDSGNPETLENLENLENRVLPRLFCGVISSSSPATTLPAATSSTPSSSSTLSTPSPSPTSTPTRTPPTTGISAESASNTPLTTATPTTSSTTSTSNWTVASTPSSPSVAVTAQTSPTPAPTIPIVVGSTSTSSATFASVPSITPSATAAQSSSGFFSNVGAVAGTFTVAGLVGVAAVIGGVMVIARRRRRSPGVPSEPPMSEIGHQSPPIIEDETMTDAGHYGGTPMPLAAPPVTYYPDYGYPRAQRSGYSLANEPGYTVSGGQGYTQGYPAVYVQDYATQNMYGPEDCGISYLPQAAHVDSMPNPYEFTDVEPDLTPVPSTQATATVDPSPLRRSANSTPTPPGQPADPHYSIDSFYTGIVVDTSTPGQAL
ncbi:hypothetical protein BU15DRAFT_58209 [Melanogaster broomeanus]|nr:hypothetical protein BU15DRAFT_58209 [Melanogaster broomeanus]